MCAPAAIGIAQDGVGVMGAMGQHSQAQAQHKYQMQVAEMQRRQQITNHNHRVAQHYEKWEDTKEIWRAQQSNYQEQLYENRDAAGKAYGVASMQEEKAFRDFVSNSASVRLQQMAAKTGALGQRGRTAQRMMMAPGQKAGLAMATAKDNLLYSLDNINYQRNQVGEEWQDKNRADWKKVSIAPKPTLGPPATFLQGDPPAPGNAGLITGIGEAVVGGLSGFMKSTPQAPAPPNLGGLSIGSSSAGYGMPYTPLFQPGSMGGINA